MNGKRSPLKKQIIGFVITGVMSTLIMYLIYLVLIQLLNYQWSYLISYSLSVVALYFMNTLMVFKRKPSLHTFLQFPLIYLLQYAFGACSLNYFIHWGIPVGIAPLPIIIIMLPITFLLNKIILFRKK